MRKQHVHNFVGNIEEGFYCLKCGFSPSPDMYEELGIGYFAEGEFYEID